MMAVRHGQKLQYQKTRDHSSLESIFQIQFQGAFMELHLLWFLGQETLNLLFC